MPNFTSGTVREPIQIRERLAREELEALQRTGQLVVDHRRRRPRYFDGRFLVAGDLTRDQEYFLSRQAELGKAGGAGVVHGLTISPDPLAPGSAVVIEPGHGVTLSGEMVMISAPLRVDLADVATSRTLGVAFDVLGKPHEPARNRTGLYVLALRPVEFTAHPITAYPTSLQGPREAFDGDVIEAAAAVLIPYGGGAARDALSELRKLVAREIFLDGQPAGQPAGTLPLAMIALDRGVIQWLDEFMVRREVGAEHRDLLSMGFAPRALRQAHLLQYHRHLDDVVAQLTAANRSPRFAAGEQFQVLPPAGRMPAAGVDPATFTHTFFPPEMDVELSAIPNDEIPGLIEDSLLLPPIDLTGATDDLDATAILVLIPVPRPKVRALRATVTSLTRALRPAAPGFLAKRTPLEALLARPVAAALAPPVQPRELVDAAWRGALAGVEFLWYVRRRTLNFRAEAAGHALRVHTSEVGDELAMVAWMKDVGLYNRFHNLKTVGSAEADAEMVFLLSSPKFRLSMTLIEGALTELRQAHRDLIAAAPPDQAERVLLDRETVLRVAQRYSDPDFGKGVLRLEEAQPELRDNEKLIKTVTRASLVPQLDLVARRLPDDELAAFAAEVLSLGDAGKTDDLATLINVKLGEIVR